MAQGSYPGSDHPHDEFATRQYVDEVTSSVQYDEVMANESTSSQSFTDLATTGPEVVVTVSHAQRALIQYGATAYNDTAGRLSSVSFEVSGATTIAANDDNSLNYESSNAGDISSIFGFMMVDLNAGVNTIKLKYRVNNNTSNFLRRRLVVTPLEPA